MKHINIEIKARCKNLDRVRKILRAHGAVYKGRDRQVDTYFATSSGRLKLREGEIENSLIHYERSDDERLRLSRITRCDTNGIGVDLKAVLLNALPVLAIVDKRREIYFVDNVKFHLDRVVSLGTFLEIE